MKTIYVDVITVNSIVVSTDEGKISSLTKL